jgi:HEAT repeat protein
MLRSRFVMGKQAFDRKLEALESLRSAPESSSTAGQLRHALKDRNNYFVSRAAAIAAERQQRPLIPDLLNAFARFLDNPVKSDPQCWAKNAIAKALKDLEHDNPDVFLKGISHFQLEPVWGGRADTAATLRGTCALALVGCRLEDLQILTCLSDALADPEKSVRMDAARAVAQLSRPEGVLLLRLKALLGDQEAEVTGQCFASYLGLAPWEAVSFVARFLDHSDLEIRIEAASALGESREAEAAVILRTYWERCREPELRSAILVSLGASPCRDAAEFLLSVLSEDPIPTAAEAMAALASSRYKSETRERAATIVAERNESVLRRVFEEGFGKPKTAR